MELLGNTSAACMHVMGRDSVEAAVGWQSESRPPTLQSIESGSKCASTRQSCEMPQPQLNENTPGDFNPLGIDPSEFIGQQACDH